MNVRPNWPPRVCATISLERDVARLSDCMRALHAAHSVRVDNYTAVEEEPPEKFCTKANHGRRKIFWGNIASHLQVLSAMQTELPFAVFEDDARLVDPAWRFDDCAPPPEDADLLWLGYGLVDYARPCYLAPVRADGTWIRASRLMCTHAYAVCTERGRAHLLNCFEEAKTRRGGCGGDLAVAYRMHEVRTYALMVPAFYQESVPKQKKSLCAMSSCAVPVSDEAGLASPPKLAVRA